MKKWPCGQRGSVNRLPGSRQPMPREPAAGVEAAYSQVIRRCGLRRARSYGPAKTHLQHLLTATALNLLRLGSWLAGTSLAPTRQSAFTRFMAMTQAA